MYKKLLLLAIAISTISGCKEKPKTELEKKVEKYAICQIGAPIKEESISTKGSEVLNLFCNIADEADKIFWKQTFGNKSIIDKLPAGAERDYAYINYGPWDRLDNDSPFIEGYGEKPIGANYYPADMTWNEWEAFEDPNKNSPYTVIRRDENGNLKTVWYHDEYKQEVDKICNLLRAASVITIKESVRNYLLKRAEALETDNYYESDLAWLNMKDSKMDLVIGPIEHYDDHLNGLKTSYECFVLLKDLNKTEQLKKYIGMLPEIQKSLPCPPEYKTFVPGTSSDMFVYDAIYCSGEANAGAKTIAINLPNDPKIHAEKGTRRLQLQNIMKAKFSKIVLPIGNILIEPKQTKHLKNDAFFWNVTFHEVAHGLGVKNTYFGNFDVAEIMGSLHSTWEEAKADIVGLWIVCDLIDKDEIPYISKKDAITTYIASLVRSVRFGAGDAHGKANMMCYNFLKEKKAFVRNKEGLYHINYDIAETAIAEWAELILTVQATGNKLFAREYTKNHANIPEALQADLANINRAKIPIDLRFDFVR